MDEEAEILRILLFYPKRFSENRQCNNCGGVGSPGCAAKGARRWGEAMGNERWGTGVMAVGRDVPIAPPG